MLINWGQIKIYIG